MAAQRHTISVSPQLCDHCGRCVPRCPRRALRVGSGVVYVDVNACDGCGDCVAACPRDALKLTAVSARPAPRSRAQVKAAREAAEKAARHAKVATHSNARAAADQAEGMVCWSLVDAAVVGAMLLLTFVAKDAAMAIQAIKLMPPQGQVVARVAVLGVFYAAQLGALAWLAGRHGSTIVRAFGLGALGRSGASKATSVALVAALLVGTRLFSLAYGASAQALGAEPPSGAAAFDAVFGPGGAGFALAALMAVVIGPFAEELAFRGVLLRATGDEWGMWPGIVISALLFAGYHFNAWTFLPMLVLGVALGWLAWSRRSIWPAIWLHALYNLVPVASAYWLAR